MNYKENEFALQLSKLATHIHVDGNKNKTWLTLKSENLKKLTTYIFKLERCEDLNLYINVEYLPEDNLFDLELKELTFYMKLNVEELDKLNDALYEILYNNNCQWSC